LKKLLIVGLGLIGGSIAKASHGYFDEIYALNKSQGTLRTAEQEQVIVRGFSSAQDCPKDIDLVCICTPISTIVPLAKQLFAAGCGRLFTDAGSTKAGIMEGMNTAGIPFIGGHPMAGREHSGYAFSSAGLLHGANWVLTPSDEKQDTQALQDWITYMGACPLVMNAAAHDRAAAAISHLPHILASALTEVAGEAEEKDAMVRKLAAGGFLDITRVASSDPTMWQNIFLNNPKYILEMLREAQNILAEWEKMIADGEAPALYDRFAKTKAIRDSYQKDFAEKAFREEV